MIVSSHCNKSPLYAKTVGNKQRQVHLRNDQWKPSEDVFLFYCLWFLRCLSVFFLFGPSVTQPVVTFKGLMTWSLPSLSSSCLSLSVSYNYLFGSVVVLFFFFFYLTSIICVSLLVLGCVVLLRCYCVFGIMIIRGYSSWKSEMVSEDIIWYKILHKTIYFSSWIHKCCCSDRMFRHAVTSEMVQSSRWLGGQFCSLTVWCSSSSGEHGELRGGVAAAGQPEEHRGRQLLVHEQAAGRNTGLRTHSTIEENALTCRVTARKNK